MGVIQMQEKGDRQRVCERKEFLATQAAFLQIKEILRDLEEKIVRYRRQR